MNCDCCEKDEADYLQALKKREGVKGGQQD